MRLRELDPVALVVGSWITFTVGIGCSGELEVQGATIVRTDYQSPDVHRFDLTFGAVTPFVLRRAVPDGYSSRRVVTLGADLFVDLAQDRRHTGRPERHRAAAGRRPH